MRLSGQKAYDVDYRCTHSSTNEVGTVGSVDSAPSPKSENLVVGSFGTSQSSRLTQQFHCMCIVRASYHLICNECILSIYFSIERSCTDVGGMETESTQLTDVMRTKIHKPRNPKLEKTTLPSSFSKGGYFLHLFPLNV